MECLIISIIGIAIIISVTLLVLLEKSINNINEILRAFEDREDEDGI